MYPGDGSGVVHGKTYGVSLQCNSCVFRSGGAIAVGTVFGAVIGCERRAMPEIELRPARPAELDAIARLLSVAELPVEDLSVTMLDAYVVATEGEVCVGVVGLEIYESNALLRSLAVEPQHRSRGLGARMVDAIETEAQARGVTAVYLLTTTATTFFERVGYTAHDRATVPPSIAATTEFSSLCPDTADCLWRDLTT